MITHPTDALSLVFGLLFVALAALGLADSLVISTSDLRWLAPVAMVVVGVVLLASTVGRTRRTVDASDETPAEAESGAENESG